MPDLCRQIGLRFLAALATVGLAVPALVASPCACAAKPAAQHAAAAKCCQTPAPADYSGCSDGGTCDCPGCECSLHSLDAIAASIVVVSISPTELPLPLALPIAANTASAEQITLAAHAEQSLARTAPVPLRTLYCVWII